MLSVMITAGWLVPGLVQFRTYLSMPVMFQTENAQVSYGKVRYSPCPQGAHRLIVETDI